MHNTINRKSLTESIYKAQQLLSRAGSRLSALGSISAKCIAIYGLVFTLAVIWSGCGDNGNDSKTKNSKAGELILDYTAFIDDATQVSGMTVNRDSGLVALTTDLEKVVKFNLTDPELKSTIFNIPWRDDARLEQGSAEAISFDSEDTVLVLYPEKNAIRRYNIINGEQILEASLPERSWFGAMAIDRDEGEIFLITNESPHKLVSIDIDTLVSKDDSTTEIDEEIELDVPDDLGTIEGLSVDRFGSGDKLWAVTKSGQIVDINPLTGSLGAPQTSGSFIEPSAIEAFVNSEGEGEEEAVFAVADDGDEFNRAGGSNEGGESPIYLLLINPSL